MTNALLIASLALSLVTLAAMVASAIFNMLTLRHIRRWRAAVEEAERLRRTRFP